MPTMRKRLLLFSLLAIPLLCLTAGLAYNLPPVHDRLAWRIENLQTSIRHAINPPEEAVFVPAGQEQQIDAIVQATLRAFFTPTPQASPTPDAPATALPAVETPLPSPTPTLVPTPLPAKVLLTGVTHEYQQMNNCGPATLAMALSYWGWQGDQGDTRLFLRPNFKVIDDKNVNPFEMVNYVVTQPGLKALARAGGDLDLLKRLVAAGFPVIIEKGFQPPKEFWMGHYELITGFDDERGRFVAQDSYIMADFPLPYAELTERWWRDFNYAYVVAYPAEREQEVLSILGPQADPAANYQYAAEKAEAELSALTGRDLFFAWYNLGSSLTAMADYAGAAQAYDQAFAIYPSIPEADRPWRMLWYQAGPYEAYYYTGRYQDVINLADTTFSAFGAAETIGLEETYYWRGLAREALGNQDGAVEDLVKAARINPASTPVMEQLDRLGAAIP
jgi:hypothetical protein